MSKWNPDEHLPECGVTRYPICICDRLRACEQRMMLLRYNEIKGWSAMKQEIAYDAALDTCIAAIQEMATIEDESGYVYVDLTVPEVLAAIDSLRSQPPKELPNHTNRVET